MLLFLLLVFFFWFVFCFYKRRGKCHFTYAFVITRSWVRGWQAMSFDLRKWGLTFLCLIFPLPALSLGSCPKRQDVRPAGVWLRATAKASRFLFPTSGHSGPEALPWAGAGEVLWGAMRRCEGPRSATHLWWRKGWPEPSHAVGRGGRGVLGNSAFWKRWLGGRRREERAQSPAAEDMWGQAGIKAARWLCAHCRLGAVAMADWGRHGWFGLGVACGVLLYSWDPVLASAGFIFILY